MRPWPGVGGRNLTSARTFGGDPCRTRHRPRQSSVRAKIVVGDVARHVLGGTLKYEQIQKLLADHGLGLADLKVCRARGGCASGAAAPVLTPARRLGRPRLAGRYRCARLRAEGRGEVQRGYRGLHTRAGAAGCVTGVRVAGVLVGQPPPMRVSDVPWGGVATVVMQGSRGKLRRLLGGCTSRTRKRCEHGKRLSRCRCAQLCAWP